jgi:hypothetical protein
VAGGREDQKRLREAGRVAEKLEKISRSLGSSAVCRDCLKSSSGVPSFSGYNSGEWAMELAGRSLSKTKLGECGPNSGCLPGS